MKGDGSIKEELDKLAPGFTWPREAPGFKVPEGYFDALPARVHAEIASSTFLPPKAAVPYAVPPGYFNTLPEQVLARAKNAGRPVKRMRPFRLRTRWLAAAVIAAIVVLAALLRLPRQQATSIDRQLASLSDAAITGYLTTEAASLNDEDLYHNLSDSLAGPVVDGLSSQDIEEYLNEDSPESY